MGATSYFQGIPEAFIRIWVTTYRETNLSLICAICLVIYVYIWQSIYTQSTSGLAKGSAWVQLKVNCKIASKWTYRCTLEAMIKHVLRCTWRRLLCVLERALGDHDWARMTMDLEAVVDHVQSWTWRQFPDVTWWAHGYYDWVTVEMHLEAVREWDWSCTWSA